MRRVLFAAVLLFACDSKDSGEGEAAKTAQADAPVLPSPQDVCSAYKAVPRPDNVFVISATTAPRSIKENFDKTAALADVTELRSESEPPDGERQMHKGFVHSRRLTLAKDGPSWKVTKEEVTSHNEIFYVRRPVGQDPRKLFGAQIIERYGPKGGVACVGEQPASHG